MENPPFFDVLYTARAMRRLRPDPVPSELVRRVLEAATMAPSGTNAQPWRFIVIREPETKRRLVLQRHLNLAAGNPWTRRP